MKDLKLSAAQIIALGFAGAILLGGILLWLPVCAAPGEQTDFIDALFTSATSVCVTGLVTVSTASHWSALGKGAILLLIQLGGLGVIAVFMFIVMLAGGHIGLKGRRLIQQTYNLDTLSGMAGVVRKIMACTLGAEALGAICYAFAFVPEFGWAKGLWQSVFTSVSAFCNAGIDVLGDDSLAPYVGNPLINVTTIALIVSGGLGFLVWWDLYRVAKNRLGWRKLKLHSKLAIASTAALILGGAVLFFLFEYGNPDTLGKLPFGSKCLAALFQSVTPRTAGFFTVDQSGFRDASAALTMILMFTGGSPMGTAGGIKTTTVALLILTVAAYLKGKSDTEAFHRRVREQDIRTAIAVAALGVAALLASGMVLSLTMDAPFIDVLFETMSALGTAGLSRGLTGDLTLTGKIIIILNMYLGRIGPITLATAIVMRAKNAGRNVHLAEENILIG